MHRLPQAVVLATDGAVRCWWCLAHTPFEHTYHMQVVWRTPATLAMQNRTLKPPLQVR